MVRYRLLRFCVIVLTGLAAGMELFFLAELQERIDWGAAQWLREAVRGSLYQPFGAFGAALEGGAAIGLILLALLVRKRSRAVGRLSTLAATMFILALLVWWTVVFPVNAELGGGGATAATLAAYRLRWEAGHAISAAMEFISFCALIWSVLLEAPDSAPETTD